MLSVLSVETRKLNRSLAALLAVAAPSLIAIFVFFNLLRGDKPARDLGDDSPTNRGSAVPSTGSKKLSNRVPWPAPTTSPPSCPGASTTPGYATPAPDRCPGHQASPPPWPTIPRSGPGSHNAPPWSPTSPTKSATRPSPAPPAPAGCPKESADPAPT